MQPPVLCYNLSGGKAASIKLLAMKLKIRVRTVSPEEFALPLAALCGYQATDAIPMTGEPFADGEMLVLANFAQPTLSAFLNGFRAAKIPAVPLKAILTDTNRQWDSMALHRELALEHAAMAAARPPAHPQPQE